MQNATTPAPQLSLTARSQFKDGMQLYEYVSSHPTGSVDSYGLWRYVPGMGKLDGSLGPAASGRPASSSLQLAFEPDRAQFSKAGCNKVRFVQIVFKDSVYTNGIKALGTAWFGDIPNRKWVVDADTEPYYPGGHGADPKTGVDSTMNDDPQAAGLYLASISYQFETCAICSKGKDTGDVYGCFEWGQSFGFTGSIFSRNLAYWKRYVDNVVWSNSLVVDVMEHRRVGPSGRVRIGGMPNPQQATGTTHSFYRAGKAPHSEMRAVLDKYFP